MNNDARVKPRRPAGRAVCMLAAAVLALPGCGGSGVAADPQAPRAVMAPAPTPTPTPAPTPAPAPAPTPAPAPAPAPAAATGGAVIDKTSYLIVSSSDASKTGVVRFERRSDGSTHAVVELDFTVDEAGVYDFHIHNNAQGGNVAVHGEVVRRTGRVDVAIVNSGIDGKPLAYPDLLNLDGYAAVHGTRYGDLYGAIGKSGRPQ